MTMNTYLFSFGKIKCSYQDVIYYTPILILYLIPFVVLLSVETETKYMIARSPESLKIIPSFVGVIIGAAFICASLFTFYWGKFLTKLSAKRQDYVSFVHRNGNTLKGKIISFLLKYVPAITVQEKKEKEKMGCLSGCSGGCASKISVVLLFVFLYFLINFLTYRIELDDQNAFIHTSAFYEGYYSFHRKEVSEIYHVVESHGSGMTGGSKEAVFIELKNGNTIQLIDYLKYDTKIRIETINFLEEVWGFEVKTK